jgi:hypothetical protein
MKGKKLCINWETCLTPLHNVCFTTEGMCNVFHLLLSKNFEKEQQNSIHNQETVLEGFIYLLMNSKRENFIHFIKPLRKIKSSVTDKTF